jgi:TPR repeat protein
MNKLILLIFLLLPLHALAKESCSPESIGLTPKSELPERLFYTGTCHYRNADYEQAVTHWVQLAKLKGVSPRFVDLQIDVLNNLGYMMFFGHGMAEDKEKAVTYWRKAVSLGHTESEYHLCHAYAERSVSTYNPSRALPHCKKALLLYQGSKTDDPDDALILKQLNKYIRQLEA